MAESGNPPSRTPDPEILDRMAALEAENQELRARIERLEQALARFARGLQGQARTLERCGE